MKFFRSLRSLADEESATSVEYAVILALILIVVIAGIATLGGQAKSLWGWVQERLDAFLS